jgi:hypothetical protein
MQWIISCTPKTFENLEFEALCQLMRKQEGKLEENNPSSGQEA